MTDRLSDERLRQLIESQMEWYSKEFVVVPMARELLALRAKLAADGRYFQNEDGDMDLVNISEEVEVVRWAVFDRATGDYMMRSYFSEQQAIENAKNSQVVVRLTGKYTR